MHLLFVAGLSCTVALCSQATTAPLRVGAVSERLSNADIDEISRQAAAQGRSTWLLSGDTSQTLPERWHIDVFLEPDLTGPSLRRGRVLRLETDVVDGISVKWRARLPVANYAQVSRAAGVFSVTLDEMSVERPFIVEGDFSAAELISLVRYLRTSPKPTPKSVRGPDGKTWNILMLPVEGTWPITSISREGSETTVTLQESTRHGRTVTVRRKGHTWEVTGVTIWVA